MNKLGWIFLLSMLFVENKSDVIILDNLDNELKLYTEKQVPGNQPKGWYITVNPPPRSGNPSVYIGPVTKQQLKELYDKAN